LSLASLSSLAYCLWVKPRTYPERCFTQVGSGVTLKH
jgi:hypothetical protein